jgi:SpoIIAA-like
MVNAVADLPSGVLGFRASGRVTVNELDQVTQAVNAALGRHEPLNFYIELADDFEGLDRDAARQGRHDALAVGLRHRKSWQRLALVTDQDWVRNYLNAFGSIVPGELRVFEPSRRGEARSWLTQRLAA